MRRRILDLRARGVFEGFVALPAASTFGLFDVGMAFYQDRSVPTADIFAVPGVISEAVLYDDCQYVLAYGLPEGLAATKAQLVPMFGVEPDREIRPAPRAGLGPERFGPLDWRVMRAFVDQPRASLAELAQATGLTARTVGARRDALISAGAVDAWPLLRSGRSGGAIYFHVTVWGASKAELAAALERHVRHTVISDSADPPMLYAFCQAKDLVEQQRIVRALEADDVVDDVRLILTLSYDVAVDNVRGLIDAQIARWQAAKSQAL